MSNFDNLYESKLNGGVKEVEPNQFEIYYVVMAVTTATHSQNEILFKTKDRATAMKQVNKWKSKAKVVISDKGQDVGKIIKSSTFVYRA